MTAGSQALIALGSNIEPETNLPQAAAHLADIGRIALISQVYETEPFGPPGQPRFLNAALALEGEMMPQMLRQALRQIERDLGRVRPSDRYAPRPIDLDLAFWLNGEALVSPDPDILRRPYLAQVLAELAPNARHPQTGQSLGEIAGELAADVRWQPRQEVQAAMVAAIGQTIPPAAAAGRASSASAAASSA